MGNSISCETHQHALQKGIRNRKVRVDFRFRIGLNEIRACKTWDGDIIR